MFESAAIDIAIGLILMYLMLSLLCTVINEFIATKLSLRARSLASTLKELLDNPKLYGDFYKHGLIIGSKQAAAAGTQSTASAVTSVVSAAVHSLKKMIESPAPAGAAAAGSPLPEQDHPSYLSGRTVALALIGSLDTSKPMPVFADIEAAVKTLPPDSRIRSALLASLTEARGDLDKLRTSIATWFDDSMERLSGAYKRQLKWISMLVGLVVTVALNADSFKVATTLWNDPARRASIAEVAKQVAQAKPETGQQVDPAKLKQQIEDTENTLGLLPIGWNCVDATTKKKRTSWECARTELRADKELPTKIFGWLLTAAALALGAPFWFDLLNKFVNLRGAGIKPQREDAKPRP
jgi:hypothetical protein